MKTNAAVLAGADDILQTSDVARMTDPPVSADAVRHWERVGLLPAVKTAGGVRLFRRADVLAFLERRRQRRG